MTIDLAFDFHGLVGLRVESEEPRVARFFDAEYAFARGTPPGDAPAIKLRWGHDHFPWLPRRGYRQHVHKLLARWRYRLSFNASRSEIEVIGNRLAIPMVHHMLVHPFLRYHASYRDSLMLHAASVVCRGRSLVLTGTGGVGKTTTSSLLLESGGQAWQLHADDYVFIGPERTTRAYLTRSHLYLDLLEWLPEAGNRLTRRERLELEVFGRVRRMSKDRLKWPLRLAASRLWPGRSAALQASLAAIVILRRAPIDSPRLIEVPAPEFPIDELLAMNYHEARHFRRLVERAPGCPAPQGWWEAWRDRERAHLQALAASTPAFWLELPSHPEGVEGLGDVLVALLSPILRAKAS